MYKYSRRVCYKSEEKKPDENSIENYEGNTATTITEYRMPEKRESVLDRYFDNITVDRIESEQKGWRSINDKPQLWRL